MKESPILFSGEMVKAILAGKKTQTRRIVKQKVHENHNGDLTIEQGIYLVGSTVPERKYLSEVYSDEIAKVSKYGGVGDKLWVRESFRLVPKTAGCDRPNPNDNYEGIRYKATWDKSNDSLNWKPSIFMPRWASRIELEITGVRIEQVQSINEDDAIAEGLSAYKEPGIDKYTYYRPTDDHDTIYSDPARAFQRLWEGINGKNSWDENPYVWVIEFKRIEAING